MPYKDPSAARAASARRMREMRQRRCIAAATPEDLAVHERRIVQAFDLYLGLAGTVAARGLVQTLADKVTPKAVAKRGCFRKPVQIDLEEAIKAAGR